MIGEIVVALLVAFVLSALLVTVFGWERPDRRGRGSAMVFLLMVLFLATWAGGLWLTPFGPMHWGLQWLPYVVVGLVVALLLAALIPTARAPRTRREALERADRQEQLEKGTVAFFGAFLWVLVLVLVVGIVAGYV